MRRTPCEELSSGYYSNVIRHIQKLSLLPPIEAYHKLDAVVEVYEIHVRVMKAIRTNAKESQEDLST